MEKTNRMLVPGQHIVLKDIIVSGYTEIQLLNYENNLDIMYGGVRPRYITSNLIPAKSIVTVIRHTKSYSFTGGGFISEIDLTCEDDRFFTYSCVIYGDTYDVIRELDTVGKLLYGNK